MTCLTGGRSVDRRRVTIEDCVIMTSGAGRHAVRRWRRQGAFDGISSAVERVLVCYCFFSMTMFGGCFVVLSAKVKLGVTETGIVYGRFGCSRLRSF